MMTNPHQEAHARLIAAKSAWSKIAVCVLHGDQHAIAVADAVLRDLVNARAAVDALVGPAGHADAGLVNTKVPRNPATSLYP